MQPSAKKPPIIWINLLVLGIPPLVALTIVPWYGFTHGYDLYEWVWFLVLITFCEMSITAGYHRLWSHKPIRPIQFFVLFLRWAAPVRCKTTAWSGQPTTVVITVMSMIMKKTPIRPVWVSGTHTSAG